MKNVSCQVMTQEFFDKFEAVIRKEAESKILSDYKIESLDELEPHKVRLFIDLNSIRARESYYSMWNNSESESYTKVHEYKKDDGSIGTFTLKEHYESVGLWKPEVVEQVFELKTVGLQSRVRIMWKGEITKVDEIDQIMSFKVINSLQTLTEQN